MTSLDILKQQPVYFYSPGEIAATGSGSAMRQFTNLRAYLDLGFNVEVIQFVQSTSGLKLRPMVDVPWHQVEYNPHPVSLLRRVAFYTGWPRSWVMEILFPVRPFVVREVAARVRQRPEALHHFEYINIACAAVDFSGLHAIWSCHDILSRRVPYLWEMHAGGPVKMNRYQHTRLWRLRQAEDWVAQANTAILNIAWHENEEFVHQRGYRAHFFPMSWPDELTLMPRPEIHHVSKLRLLHLGNVDGFIGYDSLSFLLNKVFPLLAPEKINCLELLIVGHIGESEHSREIHALAQRFPQVKFLGFVEDIRQVYAQADVQVTGGERATGMRTRIIESLVYGLPIISTVESARGVAYLQDGYNILLAPD
ncbi:MAG: glycosyltransferase, partial [Chloroflexota bacterium]